ncbi:MAG: hypothetical protein AB2693_15680, partial [Candidatus Thiodiazotropha sp.]
TQIQSNQFQKPCLSKMLKKKKKIKVSGVINVQAKQAPVTCNHHLLMIIIYLFYLFFFFFLKYWPETHLTVLSKEMQFFTINFLSS